MATITTKLLIDEEKAYNLTMEAFTAVINITTEESDLYGASVKVTSPESSAIAPITFSNSGTVTYTAHMAGTYSFTITYNGEEFTESIDISNEGTYSLVLNPYVKFAFHYSENNSSPTSVTYPEGYDNSDWDAPFAMDLSTGVPNYGDWDPNGEHAKYLRWFYPKSCMLHFDGSLGYYLDENDETKKADGTQSDVANTSYNGNAMMEWGQDGKKIWWKIIPDTDGKGFTFCVANGRVDADYHAWNHYDANGNLTDHFYTPKYFGSNISSKLRSISGQSNFVSNTRNTEVTYARANNTKGAVEWDTEVYADWLLVTMLCVLMAKSMNTQAAFGYGRNSSSNSSAIGQGTMNGKGMFYGKSNQTEGVKVFGMENIWGNVWRGIRGLLYVSNVKKVKLTHSTIDGSEVSDYNFDGSGYISAGAVSGTSGGFISHMDINEKYILPATIGGSETTYYCDGVWFSSGTMYAHVGGSWSNAGRVGGFSCNLNGAASVTGVSIGAAISCKPLAST